MPLSPTGLSRQNQKPFHSRVLARTNCLKLSSSFIAMSFPSYLSAIEYTHPHFGMVPEPCRKDRLRDVI